MYFLRQLLTSYSNTAIAKQLVRLLTVDKISVNDYLKRQTMYCICILRSTSCVRYKQGVLYNCQIGT